MDPLTALGAVASVAQLAATALSLSKTLYSLGAAIASASDDIQVLADDLKTFSQSLTLLSRLLEDSKSWYSDDIYLLTAKIIRDCAELYVKIDKILTKLGGNGKSTWKLRVKFVYKEGQIRKLLKRLRDMKGTLATILMSLQVDLQLSLLNISSSSKIQRPAEKPLEPETLQTLKQAQDAVEEGGFLPKYTVHSEQVIRCSEKGMEFSSTRYEYSSQVQRSNIIGASSAVDKMVTPNLSRGLRSDRAPSSNPFSVTQSFVALPSQPDGFPPVIARDTEMTPISASTIQSLYRPEDKFQATDSMNHERGMLKEGRYATNAKLNRSTTRSLKSTSSTESFKSAISLQEEDLNLARKVKAVQSVMHAFRTALEILNNLVDRRIHDKHGELYLSAKELENSLDRGSKDIDRKHISFFKQHGQSYIKLFTEQRSAKLQSISSNLMTEVVMKLHEYSAEHEDLQKSCFEALHSSSENTSKRVLQHLNRVVHQLPVQETLTLADEDDPAADETTSSAEIDSKLKAWSHPNETTNPKLELPIPYRMNVPYLHEQQSIPRLANTKTTVSDDSDASDYVITRKINRRERSRSHSPHHKRHLAEGALAGAGAAALLANHREKERDGLEHRHRKAPGGAALGAIGAEAVARAPAPDSSLPFIGYTFKRFGDSAGSRRLDSEVHRQNPASRNSNIDMNALPGSSNPETAHFPPTPSGSRKSAPLGRPQRVASLPPASGLDAHYQRESSATYQPTLDSNPSRPINLRYRPASPTAVFGSPITDDNFSKTVGLPGPIMSRPMSPGFRQICRLEAPAPLPNSLPRRMPTLDSLKRKRTRESPGQKDIASPTTTSSQPTSSITPTTSRVTVRQDYDDESDLEAATGLQAMRFVNVQDSRGRKSTSAGQQPARLQDEDSDSDDNKLLDLGLVGGGYEAQMSYGCDDSAPDQEDMDLVEDAVAERVRETGSEPNFKRVKRGHRDSGQHPEQRRGEIFSDNKAMDALHNFGHQFARPNPHSTIASTSTLGTNFDSDPRNRFSMGMLQRSSMPPRYEEMMDVSDGPPTPSLRESTPHSVGEHADFIEEKDQSQPPRKDLHDLKASIGQDVLSNQPLVNQRRLQSSPRERGCDMCRAAKVRCDTELPTCGRCTKLGRECFRPTPRLSERRHGLGFMASKRASWAPPLILPVLGGTGRDREFAVSTLPPNSGVTPEQALINPNLRAINTFLPPPRDASIRNAATTEAEKQKLADYQKSLLILTCGNDRRLMMCRKESPTSQSKVTETAPEITDKTFQFEGGMDFAAPAGVNDVLQDFDFDSFLHQDGEPMHFTFGTSTFLGGLAQSGKGSPSNEPQAEEPTSSTADSAHISSAPAEDGPLFVNKKQFHRIIKRRVARQKLGEKLEAQRSRPRKPYLHSSGPARRRVRGPSGRFLTEEQIAEQEKNMQGELESQTAIVGVITNEPADASLTAKQDPKSDHFPSQDDQRHRFQSTAASPDESDMTPLLCIPGFSLGRPTQTELASTYPALSHSQLSKLWWQAYLALHSTRPTSSRSVAEELRSELGLFATEYFPDDLICKRISTNIKRIWTALHDDKLDVDGMKEVMEMRGNVLRIMTTVELQLSLEVATLGWGCVWTFLAIHEYVLSSSQCEIPETLEMIKTSFTYLQDIVAIIARYAVMENLYHQTGGALSLSLKPEYQSSLLDLCTTVLEFFATSFELGRKLSQINIGGKHGEQELVKRCGELVNDIKKMDQECQGFRVVVDTVKEASDDSSSDVDTEIEDVSDEGWEVVDAGGIGRNGGAGVGLNS